MILCLDFDGVIHSYISGWKGAANIPDPPVEGAYQFLKEAVKEFNKVYIYSSRSSQVGGIKAMKSYCKKYFPHVAEFLEFPEYKPPAFLTIDDRAFCFKGIFPTIEQIKSFKPWNKED
jgi:hypothetical protein